MQKNLDAALRNIARGVDGYHSRTAAERIATLFLTHPDVTASPLGTYLASRFFGLREKAWRVLGFTSRDEKTLETLRVRQNPTVDINYARLLAQYIIANRKRVMAVSDVAERIVASILSNDGNDCNSALSHLSPIDQQSLFGFRTYCQLNTIAHDKLLSYFGDRYNTEWVRRRFLYPLVYYSISSPADEYIDGFLSFVVPESSQDGPLRHLIKFLLRDELAIDTSLSYKCYIGLRCHPYDALEIFLTHVEARFAQDGKLDESLLQILEGLARACPTPRTSRVASFLARKPSAFSLTISPTSISRGLGTDKDASEFFSSIFSMHWALGPNARPATALQRSIQGICNNRYPAFRDFADVTAVARRWCFTDAGRFLSSICTSLYILSRRSTTEELVDLCRLYMFCGAITPFLLSSPRGGEAIERNIFRIEGVSRDGLITKCDLAIADPGRYPTRAWLKAAHWRLRIPERNLRIGQWMEGVRRYIPAAPPPYLSGIDWSFVRAVLKQLRIEPFEGSTSGIYVLLLMLMEDRTSQDPPLRTAIDSFVVGRSLEEVVGWLLAEYRQNAVAFVRFFFTAEHILMLKLAPNHTAAVAERIIALGQCVRVLGFSALITEDQFDNETRELTATLLLRNIGADNFEVPWKSFHRDIVEKESHRYSAYTALSARQEEQQPLLSGARLSSPITYPNGQTVLYEFPYNDWPLVKLITGIVESFIQHPSFGIEAILSNRFRHDTLRREFIATLDRIESAMIPYTSNVVQTEIIRTVEEPILLTAQNWMNRRLHTRRASRPEALFDVSPTQLELSVLVDQLRSISIFDDIIMGVISWLQQRLETQVNDARDRFSTELVDEICATIDRQQLLLAGSEKFRNGDITRVCSTVRSAVTHRIAELSAWFSTSGETRSPLTLCELKAAVDALYEGPVVDRRFRTHIASCERSQISIAPNKVRLCFDLLSEIYANAWKRRPKNGALRIRPATLNNVDGFIFSSLALPGEPTTWSVAGERYTSLRDEIFREGNSGLVKVAALSASLIEDTAHLTAVRRRRAFHLFVPMPSG